MEKQLTEAEVRVLGVLIEKELTTPDYYPLSLNALQAGCNQKSNRDPVVNYTESDIVFTLDSLKEKRFIWQRSAAGSRVLKYEHNIRSIFPLNDAEIAVLCVLMLRGAQTIGEIRIRTERMYQFESVELVSQTLKSLSGSETPLVHELPRIPGNKENRWNHCLSGESECQTIVQAEEQSASPGHAPTGSERIHALEERVTVLQDEINSLKVEFESFRKQFE